MANRTKDEVIYVRADRRLKDRFEKKNGEPVSVRGKRLGERFTVSGITEYLEQKEKKRIEYQRIEADIEHMKEFLRDYDEWEKEPEEKSLEDNNISFYEGFDQFCEKEDIREADEDIFYGAAFGEFNREWQGEEDDKGTSFTDKEEEEEQPDYKNMPLAERVAILPEPTEDVMEELRMYEKRMGYDKDTMRSIRYKMSMYDEFLEEYEARKKQWGTEKVREFGLCKDRRSR